MKIWAVILASAIVWGVWFGIAYHKKNRKQMAYSSLFCLFAVIVELLGAFAGIAAIGFAALSVFLWKWKDGETKHENSVLKSDISNEGLETLQEPEEIKTDGQYADVATDKTSAPAPMAEQEVTPHRSSSAYIGIGFLGAGMIIGGALLKDLIGRIILMICGIALFVTAIVFSIRKVNKNSKDD